MTEEKNRKMSANLKKEKSAMSKKELKLALVAKRLSMLQDHHQTNLPPENQEKCESKQSKDMETNDHTPSEDHVNVMSKPSKNRAKSKSHKRRMSSDDNDDDESSDDDDDASSDDDESSDFDDESSIDDDDESSVDDMPLSIRLPQKKERVEKTSNNLSKQKNTKASDNPNPKTKSESHKRRKPSDDDDDDESSDDDDESSDEDMPLSIRTPQKKERVEKKRIKSNHLSKVKNSRASDNPRKPKFRRMELSEPLATGENPSSLKRAEEVQASLSAKYPSFVKLMLKSHVSGGFWLGLPKKFCDNHLPESDSTVVLVDEAGKESNTKYLAAKVGLSGGWRGFSIDHGLLEGDVLVFQLISPTKFKIYIVRGQNFGEIDGSSRLLTSNPEAEQQISEDKSQKIIQTEENKCTSSDYLSRSSSDIESGPEALDGIQLSDSDIKFEGVKGLEDFQIIVDSLVIDSKFSAITREKYYELCQSQNSFLHENFLKGLNCNLVVGIIAETVNIADAVKSCKKGSISHEDLRVWEKTLKGFEMLGMKVDFLLDHINKLLDIAVESDTPDKSNKLKESIIKRVLAEERMNMFENKLTQLKDSMEKINYEMDDEIKMSTSAWKSESRIKEITAS